MASDTEQFARDRLSEGVTLYKVVRFSEKSAKRLGDDRMIEIAQEQFQDELGFRFWDPASGLSLLLEARFVTAEDEGSFTGSPNDTFVRLSVRSHGA